MTDMDLPLYITLVPSINTFENLHFKVVDEEKNVIMEKTPMISENYNENNQEEEGIIALSGIKELPKATTDPDNGEVIPSKATYSIIMWIDETGSNQTKQDSGQIFAAKLSVMVSGENGGGITGVFSAGGTE